MKRMNSKKRIRTLRTAAMFLLAAAIVLAVILTTTPETEAGNGATGYIIIDGDTFRRYSTVTKDVSEVLSEAGIDVTDAVYSASARSSFTFISIIREKLVTVEHDGKKDALTLYNGTAADALDAAGVTLDPKDKVTCALNDEIFDGMYIKVTRVTETYSTETVTAERPYVFEDDADMNYGVNIILKRGSDGTKTVTTKTTCEDGRPVSTETVSETFIVEPKTETVRRGIKGAPEGYDGLVSTHGSSNGMVRTENLSEIDTENKTITTSDGITYTYGSTVNLKATAYTFNGGRNITYSGYPAQVGVVAMLRGTLPQGTKVFIAAKNGSWEYGTAVVGDVPARNIVDLFMDNYNDCINFGVRDCVIYVLN